MGKIMKYVNGNHIEMTDEEIARLQAEAEKAEAQERHRPLTESEVSRLLITQQVNTLEVDDQMAYRMRAFYPAWAAGVSYAAGYKVQDNDRLWRCIQAHTSQEGWEPENAASLWEGINETHAGTLADPIPYEGNMALVAGLYYTQDGKAYLCTRDTGNPVYHALSELVGLYVEMV